MTYIHHSPREKENEIFCREKISNIFFSLNNSNLKILQAIKPLNSEMPLSRSFVLTNRITNKITNKILSSCIIKRGTIRIKAESKFTAGVLIWWHLEAYKSVHISN